MNHPFTTYVKASINDFLSSSKNEGPRTNETLKLSTVFSLGPNEWTFFYFDKMLHI